MAYYLESQSEDNDDEGNHIPIPCLQKGYTLVLESNRHKGRQEQTLKCILDCCSFNIIYLVDFITRVFTP